MCGFATAFSAKLSSIITVHQIFAIFEAFEKSF
jgi:hypothetical protein